ncbi:MAG: WecB/TagA/CpsF family glycosyl transferase N-acetylglucosaminyldiphosphoundecaprenol [Candidatus Magasanikbacteria bacterium]|nr:WecB/TagA/CpsF family glycosyl transferase N-acetylglucosaminyldiphosphoundecaprenol [Candidatus Magasanikbacteria bacterium]
MTTILILGVQFNRMTRAQARVRLQEFLSDGRQHYIVTPNPEMLVKAQKDFWFHGILDSADLSVADGVGVIIASWILGRSLPERIRGTDLLEDLCELAAAQKRKVFFLGGKNQSSVERAADALQKRYKNLPIVGAEHGPTFTEPAAQFDRGQFTGVLEKIKQAEPEILVVAFGQGKQEKWIKEFLRELPSVQIAIGVGGALDYLSGGARAVPTIMRRFGLEWIWRLIHEPARLPRIWNAVIVFLWYVILWRIHLYKPVRQNVLAVITNQEGKYLLADNRRFHKLEGKPHWEFVQGGMERGETPEAALYRELEEETGSNSYMILRQLPFEDYYELPLVHRHRAKRQKIFLVKFIGAAKELTATDEIQGFRWVAKDELMTTLHPRRHNVGAKVILQI